jgi:hypothetical protein
MIRPPFSYLYNTEISFFSAISPYLRGGDFEKMSFSVESLFSDSNSDPLVSPKLPPPS